MENIVKLYIETPAYFSFREALVYLLRSPLEILHRWEKGWLYKAFRIEGQTILIRLSPTLAHEKAFAQGQPSGLTVEILEGDLTEAGVAALTREIRWWMDLDKDLTGFLELGQTEPFVGYIIERFWGLRVLKMGDVFETLCWAVLGQQINLNFAYTLKRRLIEKYGASVCHGGESYYLFPTPEAFSEVTVEHLREMQLTRSKARYLLGIAEAFRTGHLSMELLLRKEQEGYGALKEELLKLVGVGPWTADYVIMKSFSRNNAFPISDVGLHNGLKALLTLENKPTLAEVAELAKGWAGWEAYVTFYVWRHLYEDNVSFE